MATIIKGGHVLNPLSQTDGAYDIRIENGRIAAMGEHLQTTDGDAVIDAAGAYVMPGLIDLHVHFRDPGQTEKETIETGSRAAAVGGFTTVCAMPNTTPVIDTPELVRANQERAGELGLCRVLQVGAITKGMQGEELVDFAAMKAAGCLAFSEDGKSVMSARLMREAMRQTAKLDVPIFDHCEEITLVDGGVMNAGEEARRLGLPGITNAVENIIASRDIMLAEETGAKLHLCHCSTQESVDLIWDAKMKGIRVSGEVCPHHLILTDADIPNAQAAEYKMNPPLRTREDSEELQWALANNIMDVVSTDHAPHTQQEKAKGFLDAPFGIVGLETSLPLIYTYLVKTGILSMQQLIAKMSINPARVLGIDRGDIAVGKAADLVIFDAHSREVIDPARFQSKGRNTPFAGRTVNGRVLYTILGGEVTYDSNAD